MIIMVGQPSYREVQVRLAPKELSVSESEVRSFATLMHISGGKAFDWCSPELLKLRLQHSLWHIPERAERA